MSQLQLNQTSLHSSTLSHILTWVHMHWSEYFKFHANEIPVNNHPSSTGKLQRGVWKPMGKFLNLHKWKGVKSVQFDFRGRTQLNGEVLEFYCRKAGDNFQELESFDLDISGCKSIGVKEFQVFIKDGFKHLECLNIKDLRLDFYGCRSLNDQSLKILAYGITHSLNKLQKLEISFDYCNKITDEGLKKLTLTLFKNLTYLQHLFLGLEGCNQLTDKGFKALTSYANTHLNRLKYLKLTCGGCPEITDESLKYFGSSENLSIRSLQQLSLTFTWNQKIYDNGLQALIENISHFDQLQKLELIFYGCEGITNESLAKIPNSFAQLNKHLKTVILDFSSCVKISQKSRDNLVNTLNFIPSLIIK